MDINTLSIDEVNALIKRIGDEQEKRDGWRNPFLWTEQEIHELVMKEVGIDCLFPRGYEVLVKIWHPAKDYESGLTRSDHTVRSEGLTTRVGKILRMGPEAFKDPMRFPAGPRATYGEWMLFRTLERELIEVNDIRLANLRDDRFTMMTTEPDKVKTTFDLEYEHNG